MSTYLSLPPVSATAEADTTGLNPGNFTVWLQSSDISINVPYFELSHVTIQNAIPGSFVQVNITTNWTYGGTSIGTGGIDEYDPVNPPILRPGQDLLFLFGNFPASNEPPTVQCFFRFDLDIPVNKQNWAG